jgi:cold shock CspA family protein
LAFPFPEYREALANRREEKSMPNEIQKGMVTAFITKGGWGFICNAEGVRHWFHVSQFSGAPEPQVGMNVEFQISPIRNGRSLTAESVRVL